MNWHEFYSLHSEWYDRIEPSLQIVLLEDFGPETEISDAFEELDLNDRRLLFQKLCQYSVLLSFDETMHVIESCEFEERDAVAFLKMEISLGLKLEFQEFTEIPDHIESEEALVDITQLLLEQGMELSSSEIADMPDYYPIEATVLVLQKAMNDQVEFSRKDIDFLLDALYEHPALPVFVKYTLAHDPNPNYKLLEQYLEYIPAEDQTDLVKLALSQGMVLSGKEVVELSDYYANETSFRLVLKHAMDNKVEFSSKDILDLLDLVSDDALAHQVVEYAIATGVTFSAKEIGDLEDHAIAEDQLSRIRGTFLDNGGPISSEKAVEIAENCSDEKEVGKVIAAAMQRGEPFTMDQFFLVEPNLPEDMKGPFLAYILDNGAKISAQEVIEVVELDDTKATAVALTRALDRGVRFTFKQFLDMFDFLNDFMRGRLLNHVFDNGERITKQNIEEVFELCEDNLNKIVLEKAISQHLTFTAKNVMDFCEILSEKRDCDRVILYALSQGTVLTPSQICDLDGCASTSVLTQAVKYIPRNLTVRELNDLDGVVDDKLLRAIDKKQKTHAFDDDWYDDSYDYSDVGGKSNPLATLLAVDFLLDELEGRRRPGGQKFHVGDHVRVRWRGQEGTIIDAHPGGYMVSLDGGRKVESYREEDIERCF